MLENIGDRVSQKTDMSKAIEEFFKDKIDENKNHHDIDLRSRLTARAVRGHSVINFLEHFHVKEANNNLAHGLQPLSISLKRHVLSYLGESRKEIIDLFKADAESRKTSNSFSLFQPQK